MPEAFMEDEREALESTQDVERIMEEKDLAEAWFRRLVTVVVNRNGTLGDVRSVVADKDEGYVQRDLLAKIVQPHIRPPPRRYAVTLPRNGFPMPTLNDRGDWLRGADPGLLHFVDDEGTSREWGEPFVVTLVPAMHLNADYVRWMREKRKRPITVRELQALYVCNPDVRKQGQIVAHGSTALHDDGECRHALVVVGMYGARFEIHRRENNWVHLQWWFAITDDHEAVWVPWKDPR